MQPRGHGWLSRDLAQVPITGLALYRAPSGKLYVLAGEDSAVAVYEADEGRFVCRVSVFRDQPVHGIHVQQAAAVVLVWGSRSVAFFSAENLVGSSSTAVHKATALDWIYHGAISPFDSSLAVLATAHNEVVPVRYSLTTGEIVLGAAVAPSRPMLYASHLSWISEDCVLVAGGTVFGHVLVWKYRLGPGDEAATEMLFNLQGHEGSIFGVDISPPVTLADGSSVRLLASCSDDRTIRIWDITERGGAGNSQAAQLGDQVIDTGFGGRGVDDAKAGRSMEQDSDPIAAVMGHASRIWSVKLAPLCGENTLAVYSFGEDSTAQRWLLQLNSYAEEELLPIKPVTGEMAHDRTFSLHNGKHLWSNAMLVEEDNLLIATGGADSQISLIEEPITPIIAVPGEQATPPRSFMTLDVHDMLESLASSPKTASASKEIISRYDFVTHDQILVTTSLGRLLLGCLTRSNDPEWQEIDVDETLVGDLKLCYVLMAVGHGAALLGTTTGNVYFFHLPSRRVSHVAALSGKIVEMNRLSKRNQGEGSHVEVLVHLHGNSVSHYLTLDSSTGEQRGHEQVKGLDARFVATSAARINDLLIIGSRHGWLSILRRAEGETYRPILDMATRSRDAITTILPLPCRSPSEEGAYPYILATSKDGKYRIYEIERQAASVCLHLRHETSPPIGPMIVGAWFTPDAVPELILYGFRSKAFVIWNETRREELATVECGGAHRTFQLAYSESDPGRYRFAFTKTSKLSLYSSERSTHRLLKSGTHGREIRALSCNGRYVATGAEDTSIRIWEYQPGEQGGQAEMRCVATMKTHVTGIQRLLWFEDDYLFSSAGNEEFFVWRVQQLRSDYTGLAVVCEGVFTDKSADRDLRIMDLDVCRPDDGDGIIVTMGFSNSTLKTYRYTCDDGRFELFAEGSYTGACFTQTRHLGMRNGVLSVLTASTDGHLALWRAEPAGESKVRRYVLEQVAQLHQNSVKGLDTAAVEGGRCLVLTGGDDNGVGVTLLGEAQGGWTFLRRRLVRSAHAAAVTGVVLVRHGEEVVGVSVSNDQRVKTWRIPRCEEGRIELLEEACSGVADVGDVALVEQQPGRGGEGGRATFMVGGVGIEAWSLSSGLEA